MAELPPDQLQPRLAYEFRSLDWLRQALTHRSHRETATAAEPDNERLEFLGDAVIALRASERLLAAYPAAPEGELTRFRGWMVSARNLAWAARQLDLGGYLRLSRAEELAGGRTKPRLLANVLEAVVGAIHLDGGYEAAAACVDRILVSPSLARHVPGELLEFGYKSALQEWAHAHALPLPAYRVLEARGPEHAKHYLVEVTLAGAGSACGQAHSRKHAEQHAAAALLAQLA